MSAIRRPVHDPSPAANRGGKGTGAPAGGTVTRRLSALLVRTTTAELLARRQATALALFAELLSEPTLERALDAFAGDLQRRFGAERVAVALSDDRGELRLASISQQALVDVASAEAKLLLAAMEEACEIERTVRFPATDERFGVLAAHRALAGRRVRTSLVSVPLYHDTVLIGALLLERRDAGAAAGAEVCSFTDATLELLEQVALVAAPLIVLRREAARGVVARLRAGCRDVLERRLGAERPGRRLLLAVAAGVLALTVFVPVERHVVADAELVPRERRLVTAPVDGFVDEVLIAAGERVEPGQLLVRLDRRELELEIARRDSEIANAEAEFRSAMASHDRQATAVARARLERERALHELVEQRLERGDLRAPIGGLVISGDPSGSIGMPVTRGETLLEIAPAEGYEVYLFVDEMDIGDVREGQRGALALRTLSGETLALVVQSIHPVAESGNGASRFRVRAALVAAPEVTLRPGQGGVARLEAGRTTLAAKLLSPLARRVAELRWRFLG